MAASARDSTNGSDGKTARRFRNLWARTWPRACKKRWKRLSSAWRATGATCAWPAAWASTHSDLKDGEAVPEPLGAHVAAGVQKALETAVIRMAGHGRNLCLAGGLGLNALLISALENHSGFENVFVQPVSGNAGASIGAALEAWHGVGRQRERVALRTLCLGPSYTAAEIKQALENCKLRFRYLLTDDEVTGAAVAQLSDNKIVAWMHGRMEFGARALGNRSILASPLDPYSTEN